MRERRSLGVPRAPPSDMPTRTLFGFHPVVALLRQRAESIQMLYVDAARQDARVRDLLSRAKVAGIVVHAVDAGRLDALAGHREHQGVVAIVDAARPHVTLDDVLAQTTAEPPLLLVLDGVTDPHNLGACLRNADAFGAHAVVVPKDRSVGLNATVAKAASGAAETVYNARLRTRSSRIRALPASARTQPAAQPCAG